MPLRQAPPARDGRTAARPPFPLPHQPPEPPASEGERKLPRERAADRRPIREGGNRRRDRCSKITPSPCSSSSSSPRAASAPLGLPGHGAGGAPGRSRSGTPVRKRCRGLCSHARGWGWHPEPLGLAQTRRSCRGKSSFPGAASDPPAILGAKSDVSQPRQAGFVTEDAGFVTEEKPHRLFRVVSGSPPLPAVPLAACRCRWAAARGWWGRQDGAGLSGAGGVQGAAKAPCLLPFRPSHPSAEPKEPQSLPEVLGHVGSTALRGWQRSSLLGVFWL